MFYCGLNKGLKLLLKPYKIVATANIDIREWLEQRHFRGHSFCSTSRQKSEIMHQGNDEFEPINNLSKQWPMGQC